MRILTTCAAAIAALLAAPAAAAENELELWLNPAVTAEIADDTEVEFEVWQRFRDGDDTHGYRLWLYRDLSDDVTLGGAVERRFEGSTKETRFLQQLSYDLGPLEARTRLEQRRFNDEPRTAWRLRQRVGFSLPLTRDEDGWAGFANAEGFFTLRAAAPGDQTGLTGLRTLVGVEREWDRVELSLAYLRQQNIREGRPDRVAHAPYIGLTFKL